MTATATHRNPTDADERDLVLTRLIDAPREKLFDAWSQPELLKQWFAPAPFTTPDAQINLCVGGQNRITMQAPDGALYPNVGVYLEVERPRRLVFTDAFKGGWKPSAKPFMTVVLTFDEEGGKTRYTVRVRHWTVADREQHEQMGFHQGWGQCADQLTALVGRT